MSEWTSCRQCGLKHRQRPDGLCPRCRHTGPAGGPAAGPALASAPAGGPAPLPDVYDGRALPRSRFEAERADAPADSSPVTDSHWQTLAGGLAVLWLAYYLHGAFGELASGERESLRLHWAIALMYRTLGPSITVAGFGFLGAGMLASGLRRLFG